MKNRVLKLFALKFIVILLAHGIFAAAAFFIGNMLGSFQFDDFSDGELILRTLVCAFTGVGFLAYTGFKTRKYKQSIDEVTMKESLRYAAADAGVFAVFTLPVPFILSFVSLTANAAVNRIYAPQLWPYYLSGGLPIPAPVRYFIAYLAAAALYFAVQLTAFKLSRPVPARTEKQTAEITNNADIDNGNDADNVDNAADGDASPRV